MSEKYSTDELISVVENYTTGRVGVITYAECDAIIAKLRAADNLCEAIKEMMNEGEGYHRVRKAIAEYERKEW